MSIIRNWLSVASVAAILAAGQSGGAAAESASPRTLRVVGEALTPIMGVQPRFVIDAQVLPGEGAFRSEVEGWFSALAPIRGADEIRGACVEIRCALYANFDQGKIEISADLAGSGAPGGGRMVLTDGEGKTLGETALRFTSLTGPIPGVGELAAPGVVGAIELADLLMWNGAPAAFGSTEDGPVSWLQRQALADWQSDQGRPATGLILKEDLAVLRAGAQAAKARAGWTALGDPARGWTAGYPATLLPRSERKGQVQRFASADGASVLEIAVDPSLSDTAFNALVEQLSVERPGVSNRNYTRVNNDMEITYEENGREISAAYHNREGGLVRLEFSYPSARAAEMAAFKAILPRSLLVSDEIAPL
ncbi:MAG: hypothetical protein Q8M88_08690 [Phenylobacterium sp.]|uniref:hypothetical protein n=1 Tax=Phenylobacterium sp. TaxID=1871053 RepID=UPI0027375081|nr:hypothetical protein [Phenylobacterium sp.]MDP3174495.1 hypothetical protein [Phenylobacterium sp.]